jgi:hypothetical protein
MPTITNINGTADPICKCGSWLKHWQNFSKQTLPLRCPANGCYQKDLVGAHVQKAYSFDLVWYIIPLCNAHNTCKFDIDVSDTITFVTANKNETCERF